MEKDPNQKKDISQITLIFIVLISFFILIIMIINDSMNTLTGKSIFGVLFFLIIFGLVKIKKQQSGTKLDRVDQPEKPTSFPSTDSGNATDSISIDTNKANPTVSQSGTNFSKSPLDIMQNIKSWFQKFPKPKQILIMTCSFIVIIIVIIIIIFSGEAGEPDTTITGVWEHELGTLDSNRSPWVIIITSWNVDRSDIGYLYMNVAENGTFTLTYNNIIVSEGTWEEIDGTYNFLYTDPDDIIASVYWDYELKGSKLYFDRVVYFTKKID